jgi:hypothetical protein
MERNEYMAHGLDFNLIPEFEFTPTFMCLPQELEEAMRIFPETAERMEGALMFCGQMRGCSPEKISHAATRAGRYFRAALAEYASIEESFNRERPAGTPKFELHDTENPLPHIFKQLRHLQIHLVTNEMAGRKISLVLKNVPGAEPVEFTIWMIKDLSEAQLNSLDAFKIKKNKQHYTATQAAEIVNWINTRQTDFGIHDLIYRGVVEAAERIVATYLPQAQAAAASS